MTPESEQGAARAPEEDLRQRLWERSMERLLPLLRAHLRFADAGAVLCLVRNHLHHTRLSAKEVRQLGREEPVEGAVREAWLQARADELCREVVALERESEAGEARFMACVEDCERVAEYAGIGTSPERRSEIRGFYWRSYQPWISAVLFTLCRERLPGLSPEDQTLESCRDFVQDRVFAERPFNSTVQAYQPAKGKTFAQFLEYRLIRRCRDARKRFAREFQARPGDPNEIEGLSLTPEMSPRLEGLSLDADMEGPAGWTEPATELEDLAGSAAAEGEGAESEPAAVRLLRCLSAVADPETRAVIELRYRAYLDPKRMAPWTLERVAQAAPAGGLEEEFRAEQEALRRLQEEEIPRLEGEHREAGARRERRRAEIELQGWPRARINRLQVEPGLTIEWLDSEARKPGTSDEHRQELRFQIECARHRLAFGALLKARDQLARYRAAKHPWVRPQAEIGRLLSLDQVRVSRRLKSGLAAMLDWLRSNPAPDKGSPMVE